MQTSGKSFTILELLIVLSIIVFLSGLFFAISGYVQRKAACARTATEIAAISAALENYQADNGIYPTTAATNELQPDKEGDPRRSAYQNASLDLYKELSGDHDANRIVNLSDDLLGSGVIPKTYFTFRSNNLLLQPLLPGGLLIAIRDPFGNSYGYSTAKASNPTGTEGHNVTFDLWSTAGTLSTSATPDQSQWIKNW